MNQFNKVDETNTDKQFNAYANPSQFNRVKKANIDIQLDI